MSFDMTQFYQVFFEEAGEHLSNMESLLLALDIQNPDAEELNAIFRAAHSIKGSAGTFGFNDMAEVTHVLENLLDRLRKGEIALRDDMIDAFLQARDVLGTQLATHRDGSPPNPEAAAAIMQQLRQLTTDQVVITPALVESVPSESTDTFPVNAVHLSFIIDGEHQAVDGLVSNTLEELSSFAESVVEHRPTTEGDPWLIKLTSIEGRTGIDLEVIRNVLEFVARTDSVRIIEPTDSHTGTQNDESAYGLFDADVVKVPQSDAAFGLFEQLPSDTKPDDAVDAAYGLFTDEAVTTTQVDDKPENKSLLAENAAYGLFADTPATHPAIKDASAPVTIPVAETKPTTSSANPATAKSPAADTTIRVGIDKVDQLINLVGELVITQAMLVQAADVIDPVTFERLHNGLAQLERNTRDLQESVMSIRMMPISVVFNRFPRVVRELSHKLGKQVELRTAGETTELDRGLIERISDPLTHLVRNSLDHGIESAERRVAAGKQPGGVITLKAYQQSGNVVIEVGDDGAGLDRSRILAKARERGLPVHDGMADAEVWNLIFEPGFSTAEQITDVSGRGVGMDVVKRNIAALGGRVDIDSMTGVGTRITVRLPLTLAILDGMSVAVSSETYIIPLGYVIESMQPIGTMIKSVGGAERLIQVRGEYLPIIPLHEVFGIEMAVTDFMQGIMVILEADGNKAALFVDALVGQHQVVIKSLEANYRKVVGISGATIMGDGHVAFILDVAALVNHAQVSHAQTVVNASV